MEKTAENYAVYLLEKRDYGEKELIKKISQKYPESESVKAVEKMKDYGYIDDRKYARHIAEKYFTAYGKKRVSEELYKRLISREIISETLEECYDPDIETKTVIKLINQKTKGNFPEDREGQSKLFAFLYRKGFSSNGITSALYELKRSVEEEFTDEQ